MKDFIRRALSDGTEPSSTRLIVTVAMALLIPALVGVWTYLSITKGQMQSIDTTITGFVAILGSWHIGGKFMETKG